MRKIVAGLFMTLDGLTESPDKWSFPYFNDEVGQIITSNMESSDTMLLGRRTYQEWAEYWPDKTAEDDPFAGYINETPKLVASATLKTLEWENSTIVAGTGKRFFENGASPVGLKLIDSKTLSNGVLSLTYGRADA